MGERTVNIGLSLRADICWPTCFESLLKDLKLDPMDSLAVIVRRGGLRPDLTSAE